MRGAAIKLRADGIETHLFIIVSDPHPQENVVLAFNLTDLVNYPNCCCVLNQGEHEYIRFPTAVRFFAPKLWNPETITEKINDGTFERFADASEELINKIVSGAYQSEDLDRRFLKYLPPLPQS